MCMKKEIVIVGNGGFAHEVKFIIERINEVRQEWSFLGYIDQVKGKDVVGNDEFIRDRKSTLYVVIAIGNPRIRKQVLEKYRRNSYLVFPNIIDPSVILSDKIRIGEGNIICANTVITVEVEIGNFNIINLGCTVGHNAIIKDFCTINPVSSISGDVLLKGYSDIGTGVKIIQGLTVNENVIVGAGAVVVRDIPAGCTAVGVPARIIKEKQTETEDDECGDIDNC